MTDKVFYENLKRAEQVKEKMLKNIEKANQYTKEIMELIDEKEISPETLLAINAYKKYLKAEKRLQKAQEEMDNTTYLIPQEELDAYVSITNKIEEESTS
jgi:hypothetical protein